MNGWIERWKAQEYTLVANSMQSIFVTFVTILFCDLLLLVTVSSILNCVVTVTVLIGFCDLLYFYFVTI